MKGNGQWILNLLVAFIQSWNVQNLDVIKNVIIFPPLRKKTPLKYLARIRLPTIRWPALHSGLEFLVHYSVHHTEATSALTARPGWEITGHIIMTCRWSEPPKPGQWSLLHCQRRELLSSQLSSRRPVCVCISSWRQSYVAHPFLQVEH